MASFRPAFTLVEMLVVVAIIIVIVGIIVPAATTLWNERRTAQAVNTVQGLLMTTRARALQTAGTTGATVAYLDEEQRLDDAPLRQTGEVGFFAYLDDAGVQRFVPIRRATPPPDHLTDPHKSLVWQNIFVVTDQPGQALPPPMRVVPRKALLDPADPNNADDCTNSFDCFSDEELANDDFEKPPPGIDQAQRHRNFFAVVFSPEGGLLVRRDVIIQDRADEDDPESRGIRTGLVVGPGRNTMTTRYYDALNKNPDEDKPLIDPSPAVLQGPRASAFPFLLIEPATREVALNFPSVDGLLVYDDSFFRAAATPQEKRRVLRDTARPLYISRLTGQVVRGPVGEENVSP